MDFMYPFLTFLQLGVLWPTINAYRPLLLLSMISIAIGLARRPHYPRAAAFSQPAFRYLVFFIGAQVLSVYYSGVLSMLAELQYWYVYLLFVVISILLINSVSALKRYVWGMIIGSMFVVLYGIYALYTMPDALHGRAASYGMYANNNDYTFIIIQVLPFLYLYWQADTSRIRRLLLALSLLVCVMGIFLSLSRGGMLALLLEGGLIVLLAVDRKWRAPLLLLLIPLCFAAIGYQWAKRAQNDGDNYTYEDSTDTRIELWKAAKNMVLDKPLLGVGSRRFPEYSKEYYDLSHDQVGKIAHNTYLEIAATSGLFGLISFLLMLHSLLRALKAPSGASTLQYLDATRMATLISLCGIIFRALFATKNSDWSFYLLCSIGIACTALRHPLQIEEAFEGNAPVQASRWTDGQKMPTGKGQSMIVHRIERPHRLVHRKR